MSEEKFTPGKLIACESYADNGALSHYNFVDENGDIIGMFCDEDAQIKRRMKREKAYANLFAAAPVMYALLKMIADPTTFMGAKTCEELRTAIETVLKKAQGEA